VVVAVVRADGRLPEQLAGVLVDRDDDPALAGVDDDVLPLACVSMCSAESQSLMSCGVSW
jgi:hypothetical protein